jgi:hypothetical protein
MNWRVPTTYLQRLGDALALLCAGNRPTDEMMMAWLHPERDDIRLQAFACEHGPSWAQGIAVIDAARVLADQPTEILCLGGPQLDHERHNALRGDLPTAAPASGGRMPAAPKECEGRTTLQATASPLDYLIPLGLAQLVIVQVPHKYRHAKLLKALTAIAHHYGARQKDIFSLDPLTYDFAPDSSVTAAQNADPRNSLADAFTGKTQGFKAFELWSFDGETAVLVRRQIPES